MTDQPSSPEPVRIAPPNSTLAIVSLATGIAAYIIIPVIGALAAVITGHLAKKEIRESEGALGGSGFATAGLVLGYVQIVLGVVPLCVILLLALMGPAIGNVFSNIIMDI